MDVEGASENLERLRAELGDEYEIYPISAATGEGLEKLMYRVAEILPTLAAPEIFVREEEHHRVTRAEAQERFHLAKDGDVFVVSGKEVERHVAMTIFESEEGVYRFQNILKVMGIDQALRQAGIQEGDKVNIAGVEFQWQD